MHLLASDPSAVAGLMGNVVEDYVSTHFLDAEKHRNAVDRNAAEQLLEITLRESLHAMQACAFHAIGLYHCKVPQVQMAKRRSRGRCVGGILDGAVRNALAA